jgi:hypothetical protein
MHKTIGLFIPVALAFGSLVLGCSNSETKGAAGTSATGKSSAAAATATAAATSAAAPPAKLTLSATCTTKHGARILGCTEFYGKVPEKAEATCKTDGGTFVTGATPCTADGAVGKCEPKAPGSDASESEVSYKTSVGDAKGSCELLGKTWTALGAK